MKGKEDAKKKHKRRSEEHDRGGRGGRKTRHPK
jgi:hypothetical protein